MRLINLPASVHRESDAVMEVAPFSSRAGVTQNVQVAEGSSSVPPSRTGKRKRVYGRRGERDHPGPLLRVDVLDVPASSPAPDDTHHPQATRENGPVVDPSYRAVAHEFPAVESAKQSAQFDPKAPAKKRLRALPSRRYTVKRPVVEASGSSQPGLVPSLSLFTVHVDRTALAPSAEAPPGSSQYPDAADPSGSCVQEPRPVPDSIAPDGPDDVVQPDPRDDLQYAAQRSANNASEQSTLSTSSLATHAGDVRKRPCGMLVKMSI